MDQARIDTDAKLKAMEKRLSGIYRESQRDIAQKWNEYMSSSKSVIDSKQKLLSDAMSSGDKEEIAKAKKALEDAKLEQTLLNKQYKDMLDDITTKLAHVNEIATAYINGQMPNIYAINHNAIEPTADSLGIDFTIVNERAVQELVESGDITLPKRKMSIPKDKLWNTKQLNSSLLQGIIQGESMDKIARRILPVVDNNRKSAIRMARTMTTGAENLGRLDSYKELEDAGVILTKIWSATMDERTRLSHMMMDGEEVGIKKKFSNGLMYPGDPSGDGSEVWNCRCSMEVNIKGFKGGRR